MFERIAGLSLLISLVAGLGGCTWLTEADYDARTDADGDGYASATLGGDDCDDRDPSVNPAADEVCDGIDDDCDGLVDDDDPGVSGTST